MDDYAPLKRPKQSDDEEELLRMQEQFLCKKQEPSAKVVNLRKHSHGNENMLCKAHHQSTGKIRSKFSEQKRLRTQDKLSTSDTIGNVINPTIKHKIPKNVADDANHLMNNVPSMPTSIILGNIVEKNYLAEEYDFKPSLKIMNSQDTGFPRVFVSDMKTESNSTQSIFLQHISKKEELIHNYTASVPTTSKGSVIKIEGGSTLIEGSWADEIHTTNINKLSQMSPEEILKQKQQLEAILNPDTIQFLRSRKEKKNRMIDKSPKQQISGENENNVAFKTSNNDEATEKLDSHNQTGNEKQNVATLKANLSTNTTSALMEYNAEEEIPDPSVELLAEAKEKGWVHMDHVEPIKLKWMTNISNNQKDEKPPNEPYNARFNFDGVLLPFKDDNLTIDKGLHHHGEEPQRPGYSLQELLTLTRSATQQQRCMALNTLASIIEKSRKGWYDKALYPAPLVALSQKNTLFLLRFSMDDTSRAVVTASLQALRSYLYSEADEVCLDRLFGWNNFVEPALQPSLNDTTDTSSLKDDELAQLDAIAALIRSDVVLRIRYILSEMQPPPVGVTCALEILIRLARRSHIDALNIASTPHLLDIITKNFMPLSADKLVMTDTIDNVYGVPVTAAVKLCRILICYGGKPVAVRLNNLRVMQPILSYISSDAGKDGIHLTIESLRLWCLLLDHNVAIDSLDGAQLTLISQLELLVSNHDIGNLSELACDHAANLIMVASYKNSLHSNLAVLLRKWSTQFSSIGSPSWCAMKLLAQTLLAVNDISSFNTKWMSSSCIYSSLRSTSNLLSGFVLTDEREPLCLPNFGVLTQNGDLQPIVSKQSCIPFLAKILHFLCDHSRHTELETLLTHQAVQKYLQHLVSVKWSLERSWYTRMELTLLTAIVKSATVLKNKLSSSMIDIIWKLTINLISTLPADAIYDVKQLLKIALSNEDLQLQFVINKLTKLFLENEDEEVNIEITHDAASLYQKYISLSGNWNEAAMPKDWLYLPVVHIYTHCKNSGTCNEEHKSSILIVLSLELGLPELAKQLSPTLRFSRLLLIYLCDTLYLSKDVAILLRRAMLRLLHNYYKELDFNANLPGLNSFTDLYTAICEHFCSTSYGDENFGMILLVPIAQRHDVHYRKLLWSEHAAALRYLRLSHDKLMIPFTEYLYPEEEDTSLIESYLTCLVRGTVRQEWCPLLYKIAVHHSAMYLKRATNLAVRMRTQIEKLPNEDLAQMLLCYQPLPL